MRILVIGGTVFVGRAATDAALARGHEVAHFNRGRTAPPDPRVQTIHGDRGGPEALRRAKGPWDAVLDSSGYLPQVVARSCAAFADVPRYLFVSSISVYSAFDAPSFDERAAVAPPPSPLPDAMTPALYGPLKTGCEEAVRGTFGERATIVRPGLVVGPRDPTDRFTYWPVRVARGGKVLAPGRPSRRVQFIDARDLGEFMVELLEREATGTFNATGPREPVTMEEVLATCNVVAGSDATFAWADDEFLLGAKVAPWTGLPLWIPESDAAMKGLMSADLARPLAHGLAFRPLATTIADTLAWARSRAPDHAWKAGLSATAEADLVARLEKGERR